MSGEDALYVGHVLHRRLRPRAHRLRYRMFSLLIDLDTIAQNAARLRLFSHNRFNLFSLYDADYAGDRRLGLRARAAETLRDAGIRFDIGAIRLLTMPRVLGYGFNPLSLFFCHDRDGALRAIVHEVHNTFGERHLYPIAVDGPGEVIRQQTGKTFHVSPFLPMQLRYTFRIRPPRAGGELSVAIEVADAGGVMLVAVHRARHRRLDDAALARVFITHPLLGLKVSGAILWEALKLWRRGVPTYPHPGSTA